MIPSIPSSRFVGWVRSEVRSDCVAVVSMVSSVVGGWFGGRSEPATRKCSPFTPPRSAHRSFPATEPWRLPGWSAG